MTDHRTAATARDALTTALVRTDNVGGWRGYEDWADRLLAALPAGWTLAAAEAPALRERIAALEGDVAAWRKLARGHCGSACTDEEHGRLLPLYAVNRVPTPATDPRQRPKNVGGPAVAAYFATPAADEARCVGCHEQGIDHPRGTEHPHR